MKDDLTMANINLYAVLRNLEDLCELDAEMKALIQNVKLSIQFLVKDGPKAVIRFESGKCTFERGVHASAVKLYFKSPQHFNNMVEGKASPIPLKGLTKLKFLTTDFTKLTDRLSYYLKPTEELLKNPKYREINTTLTAYTAFFALAEIGNTDPIGKLNGSRIPNGNIAVGIKNGPGINIHVQAGNLVSHKGLPTQFRASMMFEDMETAGKLLNGKVDSYSCIASKTLRLKGFIPMLDNMNKLLGQVPDYL